MTDHIIPLKRCTKCGEEKPATREYFSPKKDAYDGLDPRCKSCKSSYIQRRYADDPAFRTRTRQYSKERYARDPQKYNEQSARRARERHANDPILREQKKTPHGRNIPRLSHLESRLKSNQRLRERYANDPEFRERDREKKRKQGQTEHGKALRRARDGRRRAYKKGAKGFYTSDDIERQYRAQKAKCWHCGKPLNGKFHIDHLIPLAKGGTNWPNNIVCACAKCNLSKGARLPQEWNGRLF